MFESHNDVDLEAVACVHYLDTIPCENWYI